MKIKIDEKCAQYITEDIIDFRIKELINKGQFLCEYFNPDISNNIIRYTTISINDSIGKIINIDVENKEVEFIPSNDKFDCSLEYVAILRAILLHNDDDIQIHNLICFDIKIKNGADQ